MWRSWSGNKSPHGGVPRDPHARRNAALREDAFVGRHASLVNAGTDADGQPKLFGLWSTFPWHLQKESALLALHFGSVGLFIILLLLLALVSIWPLFASIAANEVQPEYDMFYQPALGAAFLPAVTDCPKPSEVTTFASKMSPGNFCNDIGNTSRYYCATECFVPYIRGVPQPPVSQCLPPCSTMATEADDAPAGPCCTLQEAADEEKQQIPAAFLWLWCVVGTLVFGIWMLLLQYLQYGFAEAGNVKNVNMAQYAVLLSNVGGADCDDRALKDFGRRYGDVVAAFHVRNLGRFLTPTLELQRRLELVEELERIEEEQKPPPPLPGTAPIQLPGRFDSRVAKLFLFVYKRILCLHRSTTAKKRVLQETEDACRSRILARTREADSSTGNAIIIFDSVASVADMLHEHNWRNRFGSMLFPPGWGRALNVATGGLFARTPKITLQKTRGNRVQTVQRHVSVRRAPEPSDIWWENTLYGGLRVVARRVFAWSLYVLLLCFALAVQTVLAVYAKRERDDNRIRAPPPPREEDGGFNLNDVRDTVDPWKFTIGKAIATMAFSGLGTVLCQFISDIELYLTSTQHTGSLVVKLTVFNLLNGFLVPTIAIAWSGRGEDSGGIEEDRGMRLWFSPGGLPDIALLVQLSNVVMPNVLALFRFMDMLNFHFLSRMACSKLYACNYLHPPAFRLYQRLPSAIYTLGLSILYTPVLPISPLIGIVALLVQYAVDQYIALRHSSKPRSFQVEALAAVNYVVRMLPLVQIGLVWVLFHEGVVNVGVPAAIGIAIWAAFAVIPMLHTARMRFFKHWVEGGRPLLLDWAKKPGDKQPTWTHHRQHTSTMSIVPDVPDGIRFNYDTYLPDCVFLDPSIFTQHVKPHFYHHNPPLSQIAPAEARGAARTLQIYQRVQPSAAVTQALQSLRAVTAPTAAEKTCSFRPQELQEGPALPPDSRGGWWPLPRLLGRGSVVGRVAAGLGAIREADGEEEEEGGPAEPKPLSPTFMPPAACAFVTPDGGMSAVSATGRQLFVPGGSMGGTTRGTYIPDVTMSSQHNGSEPPAPTPPMSLESK